MLLSEGMNVKVLLLPDGEDPDSFARNHSAADFVDFIKTNQHVGKEARSTHKHNVIAYKNSLKEMENQKNCPYCKVELVLRNGKNGEFYGCKNFPKCRYTLKK